MVQEVPGFAANSRVLTNYDWLVAAGELFTVHAAALAVPDASALEVLVRIGDDPLALGFIIDAGGASSAELLEDVSVTVAGVAINPVNRNRVRADTIGPLNSTFFSGPTYTGGDPLFPGGILIPGEEGNKSVGGEISTAADYILLPNTDYVMKVTNTAGVAKNLSVRLLAHERLL